MMSNICDIHLPPQKKNKKNNPTSHSQDCVTLRLGSPTLLFTPPSPSGSNSDQKGDPRYPPILAMQGQDPSVGFGGAFERGKILHLLSGGPRRCQKNDISCGSCIPPSGEAGGVSRCRRNLLFAPVLEETGEGRRGGGGSGEGGRGEAGSCYYLILFSFLHPGMSAMCRLGWGGRESLQPLERDSLVLLWRQDMTRLPKTPGETPALIPARAGGRGDEKSARGAQHPTARGD